MSKKEVEMEENFMYIQNLPFVLKIQKKMKKLKKENKLLNKLVLHLSESIQTSEVVDLTSNDSDEERINYSIEEDEPTKSVTFEKDVKLEVVGNRPAEWDYQKIEKGITDASKTFHNENDLVV